MNRATTAMRNLGPGDPPAAAPEPADERERVPAEVGNVQTPLRPLGQYRGAIDGNRGPATRSAPQRFQRSSGIRFAGRLSPRSVAAMGINLDGLRQPAAITLLGCVFRAVA